MMLSWLSLETLAVLCAIAYLFLAIRENIYCWYFALVSTVLYAWIFRGVNLYMESALNIYYVMMALYGWFCWKTPKTKIKRLKIKSWELSRHIKVVSMICFMSIISGVMLDLNTSARLPYLDSLTTWGSVITTFMVARKVLENWLYWIVLNSLSIFLLIDRELYQTATLFMIYIVMSVAGYIHWRAIYQRENKQYPSADVESVANLESQ